MSPNASTESDSSLFMTMITKGVAGSDAPKTFDWILFIAVIIGCLKLLTWVWAVLKAFNQHCCRARCQRKDRIYRLYGRTEASGIKSAVSEPLLKEQRSWAVVTGGSDGIGYATAMNLAVNSGFNICIVARNEEKMKSKLATISAEASKAGQNIETKYVIADFGSMYSIEEYQSIIGEPLKGLDIGMLFINAGTVVFGPFDWTTQEEVQRQTMLNVHHAVYTAKVLSAQMLRRAEKTSKKSAIVLTTSIMGECPVSGVTVYSGAKAFSDFVAQGLAVEFKGKIDVMSYRAGQVTTNIYVDKDLLKNPGFISPEDAAKCCLRDLGHGSTTNGAFMHKFNIRPVSLLQKVILSKAYAQYQKEHPGFIKPS